MPHQPFYDPTKTYEENYADGPFGVFADQSSIEREGDPQDDFLGSPVYLPFGIPAGPLLNSRFVAAAFRKGFDIATYKTVRSRSYPCHPWPNVLPVRIAGDLTVDRAQQPVTTTTDYSEPLSITNSFGVPSKEPDVWQPDMEKAVKSAQTGQVMIGSFQGTPSKNHSVKAFVQDFATTAKLVQEAGAKILEVNLSCPNEGTAHLVCFDIPRTRAVVEAIKNAIGDTPLLVKIAYMDEETLRRFIQTIGPFVAGIVAINTIPAVVRNEKGEQALPGEGRLKSGISGHPIRWAGLDMVRRLRQLRDELGFSYRIVGVGGVTEPADYREYREAGANAVMSATGAMRNPYLAKEIYNLEKERGNNGWTATKRTSFQSSRKSVQS